MKITHKGGKGGTMNNFRGSVGQYRLSVGTCLMLIGRAGLFIVIGTNQKCPGYGAKRGPAKISCLFYICKYLGREHIYSYDQLEVWK